MTRGGQALAVRARPIAAPDLPGFYVIAKQPAEIINSQILR